MSSQAAHDVERDLSPKTVKRMLIGGAFAAGAWLVFYGLWAAFPLVRPGHVQIYDEKIAMVGHDRIFDPEAPVKLVISGNSRILSGFKPEVFRARSGDAVSAFNLGLPNAAHFIDELETLVARGEVPTHVFLTVPWATESKLSGYARFLDDDSLMEALFPFRRLVRNVTLFGIRSISRGGPVAFYRKGQEYTDEMREAGGYFFIEGQSHFPGDRLPDDFRLDSDDPNQPEVREIRLEGPVFERLLELREQAGFRISFVPYYIRDSAAAPAPSERGTRDSLASVGIDLVEPTYWLYPNRLFSDPMHLNPSGADCYTHRLWEATRSILLGPDATGPDAGPDEPLETCPSDDRS